MIFISYYMSFFTDSLNHFKVVMTLRNKIPYYIFMPSFTKLEDIYDIIYIVIFSFKFYKFIVTI